MIKWFNVKAKNGVATLYSNSITLNTTAMYPFEEAHRVQVGMDDDGNIVKLVDRPHFSHYNSSNDYESGFMKEELDLYEAFKLFEGIDDKTAVLIYGKFNPPTKAHRAMMEVIADKAKEVNGDAFVYPSLKSGDEKHPMSYAQKLKWVKKAFGDILTVVESDAKNPYEALHDLYEKG